MMEIMQYASTGVDVPAGDLRDEVRRQPGPDEIIIPEQRYQMVKLLVGLGERESAE